MRRKNSEKVKSLANIGLFTALLCAFSQIAVPLPFTPVPITLSMLCLFLLSLILPLRDSFAAVSVYCLLGAVGLPVFSSFRGGIAVILSPGGGYIIGYIFCALFCSFSIKLMSKTKKAINIKALKFIGCIIGLSACYLTGLLWFMKMTATALIPAFAATVLPFLPFDIIKVLLALFVSENKIIKNLLK